MPAESANPTSQIRFEVAREGDLPGMMRILNKEIETGVNCFRMKPLSPVDQSNWWRARENGRYPAWVAKCGAAVVGWASLSRWSAYEAYDGTAEISIWIAPEFHRRGIGRELFKRVIEFAERNRFRVILSRVEAQNAASLALHESFGFTTVGTMNNVGEKFGRLLDVVILQLQLANFSGDKTRERPTNPSP